MNATREESKEPIARYVIVLTIAGTLALVAAMLAYTRYGGAVLARLDVSVGEVLMEEGHRFHDAGARANARERYTLALASDFAGPQNRAATEKLLGQLLYEEGEFAAALPHLDTATTGEHIQINAFELRVESLIQLDRWGDVPPVLEQWRAAANAMNRPEHLAAAAYYAGRYAMQQDDRASAIAAYERAVAITPGGRSASELAGLYFEDGDPDRALEQIDAYLQSGAPGKRAEWMRNLRDRILREREV